MSGLEFEHEAGLTNSIPRSTELFFQQMHPLLKHKMLQSLFKIYFLL